MTLGPLDEPHGTLHEFSFLNVGSIKMPIVAIAIRTASAAAAMPAQAGPISDFDARADQGPVAVEPEKRS
jgi:hypothetical protein